MHFSYYVVINTVTSLAKLIILPWKRIDIIYRWCQNSWGSNSSWITLLVEQFNLKTTNTTPNRLMLSNSISYYISFTYVLLHIYKHMQIILITSIYLIMHAHKYLHGTNAHICYSLTIMWTWWKAYFFLKSCIFRLQSSMLRQYYMFIETHIKNR